MLECLQPMEMVQVKLGWRSVPKESGMTMGRGMGKEPWFSCWSRLEPALPLRLART